MKQRRILVYIIGLFIMTIGISFSVKSNLGVSPVSSIPYTMTLVWGIEMGKATILMHSVLIALQVIILRKDFKLISLLQLVVSIMFGYFTTFSNYMMSFLPATDNYVIRLVYLAISIVCVAGGILLYLTADIMPLAGEGIIGAVAFKTGKPFPKVKVGFDVSMVGISLITCATSIHSFGSVREGTIIASIMVGMVLDVFTKYFKESLVQYLYGKTEAVQQKQEQAV